MVYSAPIMRSMSGFFLHFALLTSSDDSLRRTFKGTEWRAVRMYLQRAIPALLIMVFSAASSLNAQTFGQFTTAGTAAEGEGAVFMLAGNDVFRTGASARFNISRFSDFGVQLGLDRVCEESSFGGGVDCKLILLEDTEKLPLNLALDASFGGLDSDSARRFLFGFGVLASGVITPVSVNTVEPYVSFIVDVEHRDRKSSSNSCLCAQDSETDTDTLVRAGVRLTITEETQVMIEVGLNGTALFGAAFNVIF
jgi:hypothetical protein